MILVCHMILQDYVMKGSLTLWAVPKVNHYPAKPGGHRHCSSGDIMVLVCQTNLQDHLTKGSSNSMGRSPSRQVTIRPSLTAIGTQVMEIYFSLSRDLARPRDQRVMLLYPWKLLLLSRHPAKFGSHKNSSSRDMFLVVEEQDFTCSHLYLSLLFIYKSRLKSDIGHTHLKQKQKKIHKQLLSVHPKTLTRRRKRTTQTIAKLFALYANAKMIVILKVH